MKRVLIIAVTAAVAAALAYAGEPITSHVIEVYDGDTLTVELADFICYNKDFKL